MIVEKPWGKEIWIAHNDKYAGKILNVNAGCKLSLQYHKKKMETFYIDKGIGFLTLGDRTIQVNPGEYYDIKPETIHRFEAKYDCRIIEFSTPELDDVVRVEDDYGRVE